METAGQRLKQIRERLGLRYRDVEHASQQIAHKRNHPEYAIALSRLADIENKGTVPSIYRLFSLCSIYRVNMGEMMRWYGVDPAELPAEASELPLPSTHLAGFADILPSPALPGADVETDPSRTLFLKRIQGWGKLSSGLLAGFDAQNYRYGYIGLDDWAMHPVLQPGAVVLIDIRRRRIAAGGWTGEHDRPIYFFEHRGGYCCGWCSLAGDTLVLQPHPASNLPASLYRFPDQIEVVGEVVGTAILLTARNRPAARGSAARSASPSR